MRICTDCRRLSAKAREKRNETNYSSQQTDPHVSGNLVTYTDFATTGGTVRYSNFLTSTDAAVPQN